MASYEAKMADSSDLRDISRVPNITVVGSLNIDMISTVNKAPDGGETVLSSAPIVIAPGGKGANQAAACGKLARCRPGQHTMDPTATVRMMGAVGDDNFGSELTADLEENGVDCSEVKRLPGVPTGMAIIVVEASGENRIIVNMNANGQCLPEIFPSLPMPKPDLLVLQLEIPVATVLHMTRLARDEGVPVLLNPSPFAPLPHAVYDGLDHLVMNETEARCLVGHPAAKSFGQHDMRMAAETFMEWGVKNVVITMGAKGVFAHTGEWFGFQPAEHVENVVDTTGAGDTFTGAYALGVVRNPGPSFNMADALRDGVHAAALAVKRKGAMPAIPWLSDLQDADTRFIHRSRKAPGETDAVIDSAQAPHA